MEKLNAFNVERQAAQRRILEEAQAILAERDLDDVKVLVIASPGWNAGVVGIVAGKLVEAYHRPAIVIGVNDAETRGKGSARSIPGFDMFQGIQICRDLLETCGGHEMAAGLSLHMENLEAFREADQRPCRRSADARRISFPRLAHDGDIDPSQITTCPAGRVGAPGAVRGGQPGAALRVARSADLRGQRIGKDMSHLKMRVRAEAMDPTDCIAWGRAIGRTRSARATRWKPFTRPQINEWNGRRSVQFNIKDLRRAVSWNGGDRTPCLSRGNCLFLFSTLFCSRRSPGAGGAAEISLGTDELSRARRLRRSLPAWA